MKRNKLLRQFIYDPSLCLYLPLWKLDGASIQSEDAYGRLCTVTGALWTPQGRQFDAVDDTMATPQSTDLAELSFYMWYKPLGLGVAPFWNSTVMNGAMGGFKGFNINNQDANIVQLNWGNGSYYPYLSYGVLTIGQWYYLGGTIKTFQQRAFLNGNQIGGTGADAFIPNVGTIVFHSAAFKPSCVIGEFGLFNRIMSPMEMQNLYLATKWRYQ